MNEKTTETVEKSSSNVLLITFAILAVLAIVATGVYFSINTSKSAETMEEADSAVARVNGEEISQSEYNRSVAQITGVYASQGADPTDPNVIAAVNDQALNTLINRMLMANAALSTGIAVSDSEVETEFQAAVTSLGGEEALATALSENGLSEETLRSEIRTDLLINKYLENKLEVSSITVTDEEIEAAYDTAINSSENAEEIPELADVRDVISSQLLSEKQQVAINAELERLRQEASIEVLI
ncbi:SurA N-terminal domain-containing protein [Candidatus Nomurabacteria bacterium]|nr:SurA N-terminal domain-containing protein [Candidatus Nomurabacteria bacterium]